MSRAEKASEPSMEEILSSIRKIIAEEPPSARQAAPAPQPVAAAPRSSLLGTATATTAATAQSLDDILGLADDDVPTERAKPAPAKPAASTAAPVAQPAPASALARETPSWMQQQRPSEARPAASQSPAASPDRAAVKPFFPPHEAEAAPALVAAAKPLPPSSPAAPEAKGPARDFGSVVPGRVEAALQPSNGAVLAPEARLGAPLPDWVERGVGNRQAANGTSAGRTAQSPAATQTAAPARPAESDGLTSYRPTPQPEPAGERPTSTLSEWLNGSALPGLAKSEPQLSRPAAPVAPVPAAAPASEVKTTPSPAATTQPAPATTAVTAPRSEAVTVAASQPVAPAKPVEPAAKAAAPAAELQAAPPAEAPKSAAAAVVPASVAPVTSSQASPAAKTVAVATPAASVPAAPSQALATAMPSIPMSPLGSGEAVRTLEDTVVELLRPMLRQWLDANMPRMVERALRIELAESAKPKPDAAKH